MFRQARAQTLSEAHAPRLPLPALRGRRRADPLDGRPRALDRRLRADRRGARRRSSSSTRSSGCCRGPSTPPRPPRSRIAEGLLEYPQYTRPADVRGRDVPGGPDLGRPRRGPPLARARGAPRGRSSAGPTCSSSACSTPQERRILDELAAERRRRRLTLPPRAAGHRRTPCYTPPAEGSAAVFHTTRIAQHGCAERPRRNRRVNVLDEIVSDQLRTDLPGPRLGRHRPGVSAKVVEGTRERIQVFEGIRHAPPRRRDHPLDHGPPDRQRRRRRADVQGQQPADREDRSHPPRPGPARPALLPARPGRQGRDPARATPQGRRRRGQGSEGLEGRQGAEGVRREAPAAETATPAAKA